MTGPVDAAAMRAVVIIPTHAHPGTLPLAVASVLRQDHPRLRVVIIGDGVDDDTRTAVAPLLADDRVQFQDLPKSPRHGEPARDAVIRHASDADVVAYNCDDDLWLPDHLSTMLREVATGADFVHPLPVLIRPGDRLEYLPVDVADPGGRAFETTGPPWRNAISLTGVVHTRASYLRLPHGWRTTPAGRWTDHYMWQQYLQLPGLTARTATRSTTVKPQVPPGTPAAEHVSWVTTWDERTRAPWFAADWDRLVADAVRRAAIEHSLERCRLTDALTQSAATLQSVQAEAAALAREAEVLQQTTAAQERTLERLRVALADVEQQHARTLNSRSWQVTEPLRRIRRRLRSL